MESSDKIQKKIMFTAKSDNEIGDTNNNTNDKNDNINNGSGEVVNHLNFDGNLEEYGYKLGKKSSPLLKTIEKEKLNDKKIIKENKEK